MDQPAISLPHQERIEIPDTALIKVWKTLDEHCDDDGAMFFVTKGLHDIISKSKQFNGQIKCIQQENDWYHITEYRGKAFTCSYKDCKNLYYLVESGPLNPPMEGCFYKG